MSPAAWYLSLPGYLLADYHPHLHNLHLSAHPETQFLEVFLLFSAVLPERNDNLLYLMFSYDLFKLFPRSNHGVTLYLSTLQPRVIVYETN